MRARNKLNTIYKSQKWQSLQESVRDGRMEGRRCVCVFVCAHVCARVLSHPKASYDFCVPPV